MLIKRTVIFFILVFVIFTCAQAQEDEKFRFVIMGCAHLGLCDPRDYEQAVDKIKEFNPDFVIYLGSIVDNVTASPAAPEYHLGDAFRRNVKLAPELIRARWEEFDRITARLGVPVYDVPSERNIPANNLKAAEREFLKRYKKRYYSFVFKNNLFICLDSESHNRIDLRKRGFIDGEQLVFLKKALRNSTQYNNIFIALHQSAWQPSFEKESKWFGRVHPIIKKKAKYVFGACLHFIDLKRIDDVNYVTSGSASCWPDPVINPAFPHFLVVDVAGKDASVKVVPIKPIPIERLVLEKTAKLTKEPNFFQKAKLLAIKLRDKARKAFRIGSGKEKGRVLSFRDYLLSQERAAISQPEKIIKALNIRPGMSIVDVGAGVGLFSFLLADALQGSGVVYATEIFPPAIQQITDRIKNSRYKNIIPVLVDQMGVDGFYKKHEFDIIFLCETIEMVYHPEQFLGELRPSLKKDTGRLYIIYFKGDPDFLKVEFGDFKIVMHVLKENGENFPVFKRLSNQGKDFVSHWNGGNVPDKVQEKFVEDFNAMLYDRLLFNECIEYSRCPGFKSIRWTADPGALAKLLFKSDLTLSQWLVSFLEERGAFDIQKPNLSEEEKKYLHRLNRFLLQGIFGTQLMQRVLAQDTPLYFEKNRLIAKVEAAGYTLVRDSDILPMHYFFEFERKY